MSKTKKRWVHQGGGCLIGSNREFPCDDSYEDTKTGRVISIDCTREAHFRMPESVDKISRLTSRKGVSKKVTVIDQGKE